MSKEIATSSARASALAAQLDAAISNSPAVGEIGFMKFAKGEWLYGAEATEAHADSIWAINPDSFIQGFIVWEDDEPVEEQMVGLGKPVPQTPVGADVQVGFDMLCVEGPDKGSAVQFKTCSRGGRTGVMTVIKAIGAQAAAGEPFVPLVGLGNDSYKHKKYGKIYTPVFEVEEWVTPEQLSESYTSLAPAEAEPDEAPGAAPEPQGKTRSKAQAPEDDDAEDAAPRRRRRTRG